MVAEMYDEVPDCVRTGAHSIRAQASCSLPPPASPQFNLLFTSSSTLTTALRKTRLETFRLWEIYITTLITKSIPMTQSTPSQAPFTLPTARLPSPEPANVLSQSTSTPPILNLPTNQPSAPTCTPSPAFLTVPALPADHAPNTTPITDNPPHISPAMPIAGAEYLDASHSVFNSAGRDINIHHHYQRISGACSF